MKHYCEYIAVKALIVFIRVFPLRVVYAIGSVLGLFVYYCIPIRRSVAITNLKAAFPDKSPTEIRKICRNSYRHFGMTIVEYVCLVRLSRERIKELVVFEQPRFLHEAMSHNKGVIAVTGHFSSFELFGIASGCDGIPIDVVVKPMRNPRTERLMDEMRHSNGLGVIKVKEGFAKIMCSIAKKRMVALVADQDAGHNGVMVSFFGINSSTPGGPAVLAVRTGAPMVVGFIVCEQPGKYRAYLHSIQYNVQKNEGNDVVTSITQQYTALLESYIRKYPEQYFWMHKRWKTAGLYKKR